jgi:UDP-glucuronate 4-epimerase
MQEFAKNLVRIELVNILVTGAAGFIGSHICDFFAGSNHCVIGIDNFDDFYSAGIKRLNIEQLQRNTMFRFLQVDIRDRDALDSIFDSCEFDSVIHLAAKTGVRLSLDSIAEYYDVNVNGTVSLLESMRRHKVKKLLFASSSAIYGNNHKLPFAESDHVDFPISPYASTKRSCELLCHVYTHLYQFNITCLRFFTVFGPRQRPDLAIHKFTKLIDEGKPIPFFGDGFTSRDYTYIDDIIGGVSCALSHLKGYHIYNLGGARVVNLKKIVEIIENALGKKALLNHLPLQQGDVNITWADISRARSELGYNPSYDIVSGVNRFVEWYNENRDVLYEELILDKDHLVP